MTRVVRCNRIIFVGHELGHCALMSSLAQILCENQYIVSTSFSYGGKGSWGKQTDFVEKILDSQSFVSPDPPSGFTKTEFIFAKTAVISGMALGFGNPMSLIAAGHEKRAIFKARDMGLPYGFLGDYWPVHWQVKWPEKLTIQDQWFYPFLDKAKVIATPLEKLGEAKSFSKFIPQAKFLPFDRPPENATGALLALATNQALTIANCLFSP